MNCRIIIHDLRNNSQRVIPTLVLVAEAKRAAEEFAEDHTMISVITGRGTRHRLVMKKSAGGRLRPVWQKES
jgi:hypothetical protein